MILFSISGGAPSRRGEFTPLPGVRGRVRAVPYPGYEPAGVDAWSGEYRRPPEEMRIAVAGDSVPEWADSLRGAPPGPILVGPAPAEESVYGAAAAACEAARALGRGVVLVDAPLAAARLPESAPAEGLVAVAVWRCGEEERLWRESRTLAGRIPFGVALPILPGWTGEAEYLQGFLRRCREAGVGFVAPLEVDGSGSSRAAIHSDFVRLHPDRAESHFRAIHHGDWGEGVARGRERLRDAAAAEGLAGRAPWPRGSADFESNRLALEALEDAAEGSPEPRAARLRRAVRVVEDLGRDIEALAREGNGRLLFEPDSPEWSVIERALAANPRRGR